MNAHALNPRHARFLRAYQQHGNATRAAIEAGYSVDHASKAGWRLLQRPAIREALAVPSAPLVTLPSGAQLAFSYRGELIPPDVALALAQAGQSSSERGMWAGGLTVLALLGHEVAEPGSGPTE